jgi:hypothetical protein
MSLGEMSHRAERHRSRWTATAVPGLASIPAYVDPEDLRLLLLMAPNPLSP